MKFSIRKQKAVQPVTSVSSATREPNRRKVLYGMVASLLVLAIVLGSIALYQRHVDRVNTQKRADAARVEQANVAKDNQISSLQAQVKDLQNQKLALCNNYSQLSTARSTRTLVVVPTACTVK